MDDPMSPKEAYDWLKHHKNELFKANEHLASEVDRLTRIVNSEQPAGGWEERRALLNKLEELMSAVEKRDDNVLPLVPITRKSTDSGGQGNPPWLLQLPIGAIFLCRLSVGSSHLRLGKKLKHTPTGSVLWVEANEELAFTKPQWVDGANFSNNNPFVEVLNIEQE